MKKFFRNLAIVVVLVYGVNLLIGYLIQLDNKKKGEIGLFYPPARWQEFYEQTDESIDVLFLGASLCYKGYVPEVFDELTGLNSFNMASSMQTLTTSYFVLEEVLQYQKPKVLFLEVFTRALTFEEQLESVRYNYSYMHAGEARRALFKEGLNFREKIEYAFPAYSNRDQLSRIVKYAFREIDTSQIETKYYGKGYVSSKKTISAESLDKLADFDKLSWKETPRYQTHKYYLDKLVELCKQKNIELILISSPMPKKIYNSLQIDGFLKMISETADDNNLVYLNLNDFDLGLTDTIHFEDHHLNYKGAIENTRFLAKEFNSRQE